MKSLRLLPLLLSFSLAFGTLSLYAGAGSAFAAVTRVAVVKEIKGSVKIKKSGGSKQFNAFKNMSLNEGDSLTTGSGAKVVLELADDRADKDEITVGSGSQITFTKLADDSGAKAKMNVWAGSLWVKVKSISNANDQFEIETPTAIMGVRGTNFFTGVDKETGLTKVFVAAGVVAADTDPSDGNSVSGDGGTDDLKMIYTSQEASISESESGESKTSVAPVDLDSFVESLSADILEAMIRDTANIVEENRMLTEKWLAGETVGGLAPPTTDASELDRLKNNGDNLMNNVAKEAVDKGIITEEQVKEIASGVNSTSGQNLLDLNNVKPLQLTDAERAQIAAKKQQEAEAAKKLEAEKQRREQIQKENQAILDRLRREKEARDKELARIAEEARKKAEAAYLASLDQAAQNAFKQNKQQNQANTQPAAGTNPNPNTGGNNTVTMQAQLQTDKTGTWTAPAVGDRLKLSVNFSNVGLGQKVFGYQIKVEYDETRFDFDSDEFNAKSVGSLVKDYRLKSPLKVQPAADWSDTDLGYSPLAVDHYFKSSDTAGHYVNYAVVSLPQNNGTVYDGVDLNGQHTMVVLPFKLKNSTPATFTANFSIVEILAVTKTGDVVGRLQTTGSGSTITATNATVNVTGLQPSNH